MEKEEKSETMRSALVVLSFLATIFLLPEETTSFLLKEAISPKQPYVTRVNKLPEGVDPLTRFIALDCVGLIERHGYPGEEHEITTNDGYKLLLHRIPNSPLSNNSTKKPVVFLQHGILASSDLWVLLGPGKDLAFLLADLGYDVWLGNLRGNSYCRSHVNLTTSDREFWQYSFHEIGIYDLPAMFDYVLNHTASKDLEYISHSMGTTIAYVLLSMKPEYNDKIRFFVSLAPVAYWKRTFSSLWKFFIYNMENIKIVLEAKGIYNIAPQSMLNAILTKTLCSNTSESQHACIQLFFLLVGIDYEQLDTALLSNLGLYYPAGSSTKIFYHYLQNAATGNFQNYDYGFMGNIMRYKQKIPPPYDLKKITTPVALIYGNNDGIVSKKDVAELYNRLPNVVTFENVPYDKFNHMDFMFAKDAKTLLYDRVIDLLAQF